MKRTIRYFTLLILLLQLFASYATGQDTHSQFLKPGDKMPDVSFKIHNYKTPAAKISDFKGKAVIIDLWGVYCGSCIAAMPYMQELQKQFADDLQIIMATRDNEAKVAKLALRSDNVKNNTLPSVMDDTLAYMFDYQWLPTEIWIDKNGVVKYISTGEALTKENISKFIAGENIGVKTKSDLVIDHERPLLVSWYPYYKNIGIYSYLTPSQTTYTTGGGISIKRNKQGNIHRITLDMAPLKTLYKLACGFGRQHRVFSDSRVIMKVSDSNQYTPDYNSSKNFFTYDLICEVNRSSKMIFQYMRQQLDLYFNFTTYVSKIDIPCFILNKIGNDTSYLAKTGHTKGDKSLGVYKVENVQWRIVVENLCDRFFTPLQVLDETGISPQTKVDITFNLNHWNNLPLLNKELAPYGLKVTKEKRMLDCIVIEEVD